MEPFQIAERLRERFPEDVLSIVEFGGQVSATLRKNRIVEIAKYLHDGPETDFDYLADLTAVDHLGKKAPRFEVVYHLYSMRHGHRIRLKVQVEAEDPRMESVISVWRGVDWHERECFDMFGIRFEGHPDLRRILMPDDWDGYPLRKDYPLKGPPPEEEWQGFKDVLEKSEKLRKYEWER